MKDKYNSVQCHHHSGLDLDQYLGDRCQKESISNGYHYCKKHYPLHYSGTGLDSGPGLESLSIVNMSKIPSIKDLNYVKEEPYGNN